MEKNRYMIGDVANLMGISRDTLRYYEKRGILSSEKGKNGYRYYTDQDISKLIGVLYQRRMDIGLDDMETLWTEDGTLDKLTEITNTRLAEERQAIRRHKQTIARLQITRSDCENIRHHLNQVVMQNFPDAYAIVPHADMRESVELWFQYAREHSGLDMMYVFDEYTWQRHSESLSIDYRNTQLILRRDLRDIVDYDIPDHTTPVTNPALCVSSYCISEDRTPNASVVLPMIAWAEKQGLMVSHQLYATFAFQGSQGGRKVYYQQIYIPVF
ncbi:MAG: MerR family transcriptional regulator [Clostridium sp.]|nr:MerR family transcriptional regulator [Clostridium sp.]